jgi:uncharacterized SAM-binding protein YcdF (DUF218 family)
VPDATRARRILLGAALGAIAAFACLMAGLPVLASHLATTIVVAIVLGVLAALAPQRIVVPIVVTFAILLSVVTLTPIAKRPVQSWIRHDLIPTGRLDAVVVLSSSVSADSVLDPIAADRLLSGLELMRHHDVGLVITTRPAVSRHDARPVSDADQRSLIAVAGDTTRWREVGPVHTTRDEAVRTAALLAPASNRTIAVVTSPLHTRRACGAFEAVGFHVVCVPSAERLYAIYAFSGVRGRLLALADWVYERLAMAEYRMRGWVH